MGLVEAWLGLGLPTDAAAVLLIEVDGPAAGLDAQAERITEVARELGARSVRIARDDAERAAIWRGRKSAFGAVRAHRQRLHHHGRRRAPHTARRGARRPSTGCAPSVASRQETSFTPGDGNLHPHVLFDAGDPHQQRDAFEVSEAILRMCIAMGGTISGEHGVGIEKRPMMRELFGESDLAIMERVRDAWDPARRMNPGKVLPLGGGCGEAHTGERVARWIPASLGGQSPRDDVEGPWI